MKITTFVYDPEGSLAQEILNDAAATAAPAETGVRYLTADHLGSVRLQTDSTGVPVKCLDYAPFGELLNGNFGRTDTCFGSQTQANQTMYTGQYRDKETQIDFFEARFYTSAQGRFTSPDEPLVDQDPADPQGWNLYAYGRNNPLSNIDPLGTCSVKKEGEPATDDPDEACVKQGDNSVKVTARPDDVDYDWSRLALNWVLGNTRPVESFGENDTYTKQLRSSQIVQRNERLLPQELWRASAILSFLPTLWTKV